MLQIIQHAPSELLVCHTLCACVQNGLGRGGPILLQEREDSRGTVTKVVGIPTASIEHDRIFIERKHVNPLWTTKTGSGSGTGDYYQVESRKEVRLV
jgi:hypothetical protein